MFFSKKRQHKSGQVHHDENSLYPILHVTNSLKDYQKELAKKEVESLFELGLIGRSFDSVLSEADNFQSQLLDFGQSFSNINQSAGRSGQVREDISQTVSDTQKMVSDLMNTSVEVQKSYGEMESTFTLLQNAINGIQKCMGKIVSIADETNILAINASIEAARAGVAGKSFAVVAGEVQDLAYKSAESAQDITKLIEDSIQAVDYGAALAAGTTDALSTVVDSSKKSTEMVERIAESVIQQSEALKQLTAGMEQISNVVQTNAATAQESAASARELNEQAEELKLSVHKFRLREGRR